MSAADSPSPASRDVAGVIAPPPLIFAGFLVLGLVLDVLWPAPIVGNGVSHVLRYALAGALVAAGIVIAIFGFLQFRRAGTEVHPYRPTTALVTTGLYGLSRNPLYIAQTLAYVGIALAADSAGALALIVPALLVLRVGVIAREEVYLERKFGDAYRSYTARVRRWL